MIETRPSRGFRARLEAVLPALLLGLGVVVLLEFSARAGWIPSFVLPAPSAVMIALLENFDVLDDESSCRLIADEITTRNDTYLGNLFEGLVPAGDLSEYAIVSTRAIGHIIEIGVVLEVDEKLGGG